MLRKFLFLLFSAISLHAIPQDQFLAIFGSSGYVLYKALDFANDHGFRYIKILSYEFNAFEHKIVGSCPASQTPGRYFELKDTYATIQLLCFPTRPPNDLYIIDLEKYRYLLGDE